MSPPAQFRLTPEQNALVPCCLLSYNMPLTHNKFLCSKAGYRCCQSGITLYHLCKSSLTPLYMVHEMTPMMRNQTGDSNRGEMQQTINAKPNILLSHYHAWQPYSSNGEQSSGRFAHSLYMVARPKITKSEQEFDYDKSK